jgi:hypothetical protein
MPRGILVVAVWWIISAASPSAGQNVQAQDPATQAEADKAANTDGTAFLRVDKAPENDRGCRQGEDERSSELCAQWKAADAASDAARWAMASFFVGFMGTVLLVWTLWETRQTARRELRAYVYAKGLRWQQVQNGGMPHIEVKAVWGNAGTTPGKNATFGISCVVYETDDALNEMPEIDMTSPHTSHFGPNLELSSPPVYISLDDIRRAWHGEKFIAVYSKVKYTDAFNVKRETRIGYRLGFLMQTGRPMTLDSLLELRWNSVGPHNGADDC